MKNKLVRLLQVSTMAIPILIYVWLSATIFNVKVDVIMEMTGTNIHQEHYVNESDRMFIYTINANAKYIGGVVEFNSDVRQYGVYLKDGGVIKINKDFYGINYNEETKKLEMVEFSAFKISQKERVSLPIAVFISALTILIVVLVVGGKMKWFMKHKKLGVLMSLALGTGVLYGINLIVSNMFTVFWMSTILWVIVMIEDAVFLGLKKDSDVDSLKDDLVKLLTK